MTYAELIATLQRMDPARLQDTATIYVTSEDEFFAVKAVSVVRDDVSEGILDNGHVYIETNDE